jgi:hypothetical protein
VGIPLVWLWHLPGRPAAGVSARVNTGGDAVGMDSRGKDAGDLCLFLALGRQIGRAYPAAWQKKFEICKKNVCICEKMGYNKMV